MSEFNYLVMDVRFSLLNYDMFICLQADLVRQLKADKADKAKIDSEVTILLSLKKQLAIAEGVPESDTAGKTTSNKARKGKKTA
jgi:hypothetical protein